MHILFPTIFFIFTFLLFNQNGASSVAESKTKLPFQCALNSYSITPCHQSGPDSKCWSQGCTLLWNLMDIVHKVGVPSNKKPDLGMKQAARQANIEDETTHFSPAFKVLLLFTFPSITCLYYR